MTSAIRRVKELAALINGYPFDSELFASDGDVPLLRIRDILASEFTTYLRHDDVPEEALVADGDIVIGMDGDFNVRLWNRGTAALNQRLCVLRARDGVDPRYLAYALVDPLRTINDLTYFTTVKHLASSQVTAIRLAVPSLAEQQAIANQLDADTSRIDLLVARQIQLIARLRERRQGIIDATAWKGLGSVELDETGIEPAPQAPAHWRRVRNRAILRERTDLSADGEEELLSVSHLTGVTPRSEKNVTMFEAESSEGYRVVAPGNLVINTLWAWMGALGVSHHDGIVSPAYGVYAFHEEVDTRYYEYLYRSRPYVAEMTRHSRGIWTSRLRLYPNVFQRLRVVVPPLVEQRAIADFLDDATARIDALIAKTEQFVLLVRERRSSLITTVLAEVS